MGRLPAINLYYKRNKLEKIREVLTAVGGRPLLLQFMQGCFGHLLMWRGGPSCSKALHELLAHEIRVPGVSIYEIWFHISGKNIRFSPSEYALVTGFLFGASDFDPTANHDPSDIGVYQRVCRGQPISLQTLYTRFSNHEIEDHNDNVKVAQIIALYFFALAYDERRIVDNFIWVLVDDEDAWNKFPWGSYTYQALMHYINLVPNTRVECGPHYHLFGPVWAIQLLCDEVLVAEPDEENQNYWKSSQIERPIGIDFIVPRPLTKGAGGEPILRRVSNTARRMVNETIACSNSSNSAKDAEARQPRRSKKGPHMDKGKRPRVPTSPSNNGADHTEKIRDPFSDPEFMKKHAKEVAKNVEEGLIHRFGHFVESLFRRDRRWKSHHTPPPRPSPMSSPYNFDSRPVEEVYNSDNFDSGPLHEEVHNPIHDQSGFNKQPFDPYQSSSHHSEQQHEQFNWGRYSTASEPCYFNEAASYPEHFDTGRYSTTYVASHYSDTYDYEAIFGHHLPILGPDQVDEQPHHDGINLVVQKRLPRHRKPSASFKSPFLQPNPNRVSKKIRTEYAKFLEKGPYEVRTISSSQLPLTRQFFQDIEDIEVQFIGEVSLMGEWERLNDLHWTVPEGLIHYVNGNNSTNVVPWWDAAYIITFCNINGHWVTVRICLVEWEIELYDSYYYTLSIEDREIRKTQLRPLTCLLPCLLFHSRYWRRNCYGLEEKYGECPLKPMNQEYQFMQSDEVNCGTYACMYVERLLTRWPSISWDNQHGNLKKYRERMAMNLFDITEG
ncbi:hypothetical protein C2S52_013784 [Perilla frutescens var. hirtella]|nr:hypothetical protein C2S52_013784 [Perilla frutescens var. hirtella]